MGADGTLTEISGDGITGNFRPSAIAQSGRLLIAAQQQDTNTGQQVNLYSINEKTGALSLQATADIPSQALNASGNTSGGLSAAMNDEFAYIGAANGIYAFSMAGGNLTPVPGSPFQTGRTAFTSVKLNGAFLLAAYGTNSAVQAFQIAGNGALIPRDNIQSKEALTGLAAVPSAQQVLGNLSGNRIATGVAVDPVGKFLVGTLGDDTGEGVMVFKVNAITGTLTSLPGNHRVGSTRPTDIVIASF